MMYVQHVSPKLVISVIVAIFALSAINHTIRGMRRTPQQAVTTDDEELAALNEQEVAELYDGFSSMEGAFEWNQLQTPGYLHHVQDDGDMDEFFLIVNQRDIERRLGHLRRMLKPYYHDGSSIRGDTENSDDRSIYAAGDIRTYSLQTINTLLRNNENVAFTKKWRGVDRLVLTQQCSIKRNSELGAYYCVGHKTVCVSVKSVPRFYGDDVVGGKCGAFPLSEESLEDLPESFQKAYFSTCEGEACEGRR